MEGFNEDTLFTERSTHMVDIDFVDENDDPVVPTAATWSLSTVGGTIINSRTAVNFWPTVGEVPGVPESSATITLSGADLDFIAGEPDVVSRVLTVEGTYVSGTQTGLPVRSQMIFQLARTVL